MTHPSSGSSITPVILAGGAGTRLWPVSRQGYPKQFADLGGPRSLFQDTALRLTGPGLARPVVMTGEAYRFIVTEQLGALGLLPDAVLIEPDGRSTAPAVLVAALHLAARDPGALMLVAPADHAIPDAAAFRTALEAARPAAESGAIVTFGITPDRPETGYGYLELTGPLAAETAAPVPLAGFVEKPDADRAAAMLASGRFLWNGGIFFFRADRVLAAFEAHAPQMLAPARAALDGSETDLGFSRLASAPWQQLDDISIDYAIMEKETGLVAMPFAAGWSDLGDWEALHRAGPADDSGVVTHGPATALDCADSLLWANNPVQQLVGIGLKDVIAVAMADAVLVADRAHAQEVREAVSALKAQGAAQATQFTRDHRPWGWFDSLATGRRFQVKRIVVRPGGQLSLQRHMHRSEHWIVVAGTAHVTLNGEVEMVTENQSVYIPLGAVHRLENRGKLNMTLIEVQTGPYLGEDDIERLDDSYARG